MNNLQTTAIGLDASIKTLQVDLYDGLVSLYPSISIEGFGRAYRNFKEEKSINVVPELFSEDGKEYQDAYLKDKFPFSFFFIDGENHKTQDQIVFNCPLKIVFQLDLSKFDQTSRVDAKVQKDIVRIIKNDSDGSFVIEGIEKGIRNIYGGFDINQIKLNDMHPFHVFSIYGILEYYLNNKC